MINVNSAKFRCDEPLYKSVHGGGGGGDVVTKKGTGSGTENFRSPSAPMVLCGRVGRAKRVGHVCCLS